VPLTFAGLSRDLFLLSFAAPQLSIAGGQDWEECVHEQMALQSVPVEVLSGGYSVFGFTSLSGLQHQVDLTLGASDAIVILECKNYRNALPKNELLKFKAVTDDYYMSLGPSLPRKPVFRVFGGPGDAARDLRRYAALHGIVLIDRGNWPVPFLVAHDGRSVGTPLPATATSVLSNLFRPMQRALPRLANGGYQVGSLTASIVVDDLVAAHDRWSDWFWEQVDARPGSFEEMLGRRLVRIRGAA
jgi:hypothetical protein